MINHWFRHLLQLNVRLQRSSSSSSSRKKVDEIKNNKRMREWEGREREKNLYVQKRERRFISFVLHKDENKQILCSFFFSSRLFYILQSFLIYLLVPLEAKSETFIVLFLFLSFSIPKWNDPVGSSSLSSSRQTPAFDSLSDIFISRNINWKQNGRRTSRSNWKMINICIDFKIKRSNFHWKRNTSQTSNE